MKCLRLQPGAVFYIYLFKSSADEHFKNIRLSNFCWQLVLSLNNSQITKRQNLYLSLNVEIKNTIILN